MDVKAQYPLKAEYAEKKKIRDAEIADVFTGKSNKLILIIGPCSADREDSVLDYISRLARLQEKVEKEILITTIGTASWQLPKFRLREHPADPLILLCSVCTMRKQQM
jgi:phospho-2-dehydro-3-deoxyheptonate aldolase